MIPVMIVEDEFLVRAGLRTSIDWEREGFEIVAEAKDGQEALTLYAKYHPAVVLTDIRLPKMDGISMMKALAKEKVSFIVISAYDDFQYAKESISIGVVNYFLKGNMDMEELLETLRSLKGRYGPEERTVFEERRHTVRELYLSPETVLEGFVGESGKRHVFLLYYAVQNANKQMLDAMVCDFFLRDEMGCIRLEADRGSWFVYFSMEEEGAAVRELSRMFGRYVDEEIILVQSRSLESYPNIKEAIYHILLMWENRKRNAGRRADREQGENGQSLVRIRQIETDFLEALKFRKYDQTHELLGDLKSAIIDCVSPMALFDSIYGLMGNLSRYHEDLNAARAYSGLMESLDLEYIFDTLAMYVDELREKREDNNDYILRVREYVEKHYHEPILIRDLSDYVHVSPNYLGKIFYLNTGEYLKDYINSIKMEKAKELLLSRKYQVSEVADMVGMEDQRYFSKIFKKHSGVSPKEYGRGMRGQ